MKAYKNLTFKEYQNLPGLNFSTGKHLLESSARFHYELSKTKEATPAMINGSLKHDLLLSPEEFKSNYAIFQSSFDSFRSNAAKAERDEFYAQAEAQGKTVVSADQLAKAQVTRDNLWSNYQHIIEPAEKELSVTNIVNGVPIKGRIDLLGVDEKVIDLKSIPSITVHKCRQIIGERFINVQLAWYNVLRNITKEKAMAAAIFMENESCLTRYWPISKADLERGYELVYYILEAYKLYSETGIVGIEATPDDTSMSEGWASMQNRILNQDIEL